MSALRFIRLALARTPELPAGNPDHGYEFTAPLDSEGRIDAAAWRANRKACTVRRFAPGEDDRTGHLVHTKGRRWAFHYDDEEEAAGDDEVGFRFEDHIFLPGEYVSITEHDGVTRPFRVVLMM